MFLLNMVNGRCRATQAYTTRALAEKEAANTVVRVFLKDHPGERPGHCLCGAGGLAIDIRDVPLDKPFV